MKSRAVHADLICRHQDKAAAEAASAVAVEDLAVIVAAVDLAAEEVSAETEDAVDLVVAVDSETVVDVVAEVASVVAEEDSTLHKKVQSKPTKELRFSSERNDCKRNEA